MTMKTKTLATILLLALPGLASADSRWVLDNRPSARGKGVGHAGQCDLLIARSG